MQDFLFRRVEVWVVLLLVLLGCLGAIVFGAAVLDAARGEERFGVAGQAALAVAEIPNTVRELATGKPAMAAKRPGRFKDRPGGWTFAEGATPLPGYVLLSRHDADAGRHVVELVSLADGQVHHRWWPRVAELLADVPRSSKLVSDWDSRRWRAVHPYLLDDGGLIVKDHQNYLMRLDACARKVWRIDTHLAHHSTESDGAGGFWVPGLIEPPTFANVPEEWYEDALLHVSGDGRILSAQSLPAILTDHGMEWALFNAGHQIDDPVHLNDIQPVLTDGPYWKKGDLFLSMRHISAVMLYRPSAGEIVWMKQGPWLGQHDVDILDDHRIAIFDNRAYDRGLGARVEGANRVTVYDFAADTLSGPWDEALSALEVRTLSEGLVDWLPDGGIMVEEENSARLVFLDRNAGFSASFLNKGSDGLSYVVGWSRWIDQATGDRALAAARQADCGTE